MIHPEKIADLSKRLAKAALVNSRNHDQAALAAAGAVVLLMRQSNWELHEIRSMTIDDIGMVLCGMQEGTVK